MTTISNNNIKATAVILGGTGDLGIYISKVFLKEYRAAFPTVRITTRDPNSAKAQELARLGGELHSVDEPVADIISGADVVVNALPTSISSEYMDSILGALVKHNVKVFFMSEYGMDYRLNNFAGYDLLEWTRKVGVTAKTRAATQGKVKVIALVVGMFLGHLLRPALGIDDEKNVYRPLGPASLRVAVTAEADIARTIAQLAVLALDPATAGTVPDDVRVAGQNASFADIRDAVARHKGIPKGEIKTEDVVAFRNALREHPAGRTTYEYVRVSIAEGNLDHSAFNHNELVNPGGRLWRWKTVTDDLYTGNEL